MTAEPEGAALARLWLSAAAREDITLGLESVYQMIADQVEARAPICLSSGRCCHFEQFGHRLYVTGLEAAYTLARLPAPLTREQLDQARARGDCPFLSKELCSVHPIRPLGCRVYYCDPTAQEWQMQLSERALAMVRALHDRHAIPYRYGEWRGILDYFVT